MWWWLGALVKVVGAATTVLWLAGRVSLFERAYTAHVEGLQQDAWVRGQCQDPTFMANMRAHTDVCERVRTMYGRPAWLAGLEAAVPEEVTL